MKYFFTRSSVSLVMFGALLFPGVASAWSIHDVPFVGSVFDFVFHHGDSHGDDHSGDRVGGDRSRKEGHGGRGEESGPRIAQHADIFVQATSTPVVVTYTNPSATNRTDHTSVDVSCDPASGTSFGPGRHIVLCTATDGSGTAHSRFRITVSTSPSDHYVALDYSGSTGGIADGNGGYTIQATTTEGAFVTYTATLMERNGHVDTNGTVTCLPAPGYFAIGITTISCTAADGDHKIIVVEDSGDVTVSDLAPCSSAANSCSMTSTGVMDGGSCTAVTPPETLCHVNDGGGSPMGPISPNAGPGFLTTLPGYVKPRPQIIYPDGHIVYLDTDNSSGGTSGGSTGGSGGGSIPSGFQFSHSLTVGTGGGSSGGGSASVGTVGTDVKMLQVFLNKHGYVIAKTGPGSPGNENTYFGPATKNALAKFQNANAKDVLTPVGLRRGTGVFGPTTIKFVNNLIKKGK